MAIFGVFGQALEPGNQKNLPKKIFQLPKLTGCSKIFFSPPGRISEFKKFFSSTFELPGA
jgi:hypothetical protein